MNTEALSAEAVSHGAHARVTRAPHALQPSTVRTLSRK